MLVTIGEEDSAFLRLSRSACPSLRALPCARLRFGAAPRCSTTHPTGQSADRRAGNVPTCHFVISLLCADVPCTARAAGKGGGAPAGAAQPAVSAMRLLGVEVSTAGEVAELSRRLLRLRQLLGERPDVDVVWMSTREPRCADRAGMRGCCVPGRAIARRLLMRACEGPPPALFNNALNECNQSMCHSCMPNTSTGW